jgi:biofilm protein TabA
MILDSLERLEFYAVTVGQDVCRKVLTFLSQMEKPDHLRDVELDGSRLFTRILRLPTQNRDLCRFETHRRYHDLQCIIGGDEWIDWVPRSILCPHGEYIAERDIQFYETTQYVASFPIRAGTFVFFTPEDAHRPQIRHISEFVDKIVFKIDVSLTGSWH